MTTVETISDLKKFIKSTRRQRAGLADRYGSGVRPSYVSTDLAILDERIERYEAKIKALEVGNGNLG
tara:strand:+ start:601 stop:801 length:201 start_codon:yes stop_codon:yes gene_type:complete